MVGTIEVRVMCGVPGCGKSTWAAEEASRLELDGFTTATISRDEIRFSMVKEDEDYFLRENAVFAEFVRQVNEAIKLGINYVFVDATHISPTSRRKLLSRVKHNNNTRLVYEVVTCQLFTALERNGQRAGRKQVPAGAIRNMFLQFSEPTEHEKYGFSEVRIERIDTE